MKLKKIGMLASVVALAGMLIVGTSAHAQEACAACGDALTACVSGVVEQGTACEMACRGMRGQARRGCLKECRLRAADLAAGCAAAFEDCFATCLAE